MASWSSRRKFLYAGTIVFLIVAIVFALAFSFFYKKPSCFDGIQNGNEQGIDCGGDCEKLCQTAFLPPKIVWGDAKFEQITSNLYNVASYIENDNTNASAVNVPYTITFYDTQGNYITARNGTMTIPAHRNTLVFESGIDLGKKVPAKATFEFDASPLWFPSHDTLGNLAISNKQYAENSNSSSLQVTLTNNGLVPYDDVVVGAVLYDNQDNAIGFSRTTIDQISPGGGSQVAPFTWPVSRNGRVTSIEILPLVNPPRDP